LLWGFHLDTYIQIGQAGVGVLPPHNDGWCGWRWQRYGWRQRCYGKVRAHGTISDPPKNPTEAPPPATFTPPSPWSPSISPERWNRTTAVSSPSWTASRRRTLQVLLGLVHIFFVYSRLPFASPSPAPSPTLPLRLRPPQGEQQQQQPSSSSLHDPRSTFVR
jgi:hypothetical protein